MTVVELHIKLEPGIPVYPGDPELKREVASDLKETGFGHFVHSLSDHHGTHIDAPNHQNPDMVDKGVEVFDKPQFKFNKACLIDLSGSPEVEEVDGIKYLLKITEKHLEPYIDEMKKVGAVLIRTGYDKWFEAKKSHVAGKIPFLTKEAAALLAKLDGVNVIGIDSLTIDETGASEPVHDAHFALTKTKMIIESMVNLHKIPKEFSLTSMPLIIKGATGCPVIVFAEF